MGPYISRKNEKNSCFKLFTLVKSP
uniref:Uncharacterized protein n=1 Tax=Rhizophora mucronata TaxID=61149 RepID=A0A2P2P0A8_RHIMU